MMVLSNGPNLLGWLKAISLAAILLGTKQMLASMQEIAGDKLPLISG